VATDQPLVVTNQHGDALNDLRDLFGRMLLLLLLLEKRQEANLLAAKQSISTRSLIRSVIFSIYHEAESKQISVISSF
jgi:hypothetical protein